MYESGRWLSFALLCSSLHVCILGTNGGAYCSRPDMRTPASTMFGALGRRGVAQRLVRAPGGEQSFAAG